jgi:biopolymer transport protein ExbD
MTPMVDLAFLLLTFFILTTTMYKPSTLPITFPVPNKDEKIKTELSNAITLILTRKDKILYYWGEFHAPGNEEGKPPTALEQTDFSQVRKLLMDKNKGTIEALNNAARDFNNKKLNEDQYKAKVAEIKKETTNLKAIIKTDKDAKYRNMIDMVDEMDISGIGSYGVMDSLKTAEQVLVDAIKPTL